MDPARIAKLLEPFQAPLSTAQLNNISIYIDILLRWNARTNLTAVRDPEEIVARHFGESLFAARNLFPADNGRRSLASPERSAGTDDCIDVGSGAGFPGLPIKLWAPDIRLTLIESNHKKATFLREVARALTLTDVNVFPGRAEDFPTQARVVTLRAVERFDAILPTAIRLLAPGGRLALLIGEAQVARARQLAPGLSWSVPLPIPLSSSRMLAVASRGI